MYYKFRRIAIGLLSLLLWGCEEEQIATSQAGSSFASKETYLLSTAYQKGDASVYGVQEFLFATNHTDTLTTQRYSLAHRGVAPSFLANFFFANDSFLVLDTAQESESKGLYRGLLTSQEVVWKIDFGPEVGLRVVDDSSEFPVLDAYQFPDSLNTRSGINVYVESDDGDFMTVGVQGVDGKQVFKTVPTPVATANFINGELGDILRNSDVVFLDISVFRGKSVNADGAKVNAVKISRYRYPIRVVK